MKEPESVIGLLLLLVLLGANPAAAQTWKWVSGSSSTTIVPDFGTRGEFQPTNQPPGLEHAAIWVGPDSNIYLFGGDDGSSNYYNTIWEYCPTLGQWKWVRGSNSSNATANYGTSGYPSETNDPGARSRFAWSAASNGDLWVYGGVDNSSDIYGDLWKYNFAEDRWIWYSLYNNSDSKNNDTQFPASYNQTGILGSRAGSSMYVDEDSNLVWIFCGTGLEGGSPCSLVDVWKIYVDSTKMYWVGGVTAADYGGNYNYAQGIEGNGDYPAARFGQSLWKESNGKFYFFGGDCPSGYLSDFWSWNPDNGEWTWLPNGTDPYSNEFNLLNAHTIYYPTTFVGARYGSASWMKSDTELVVYGGYGYGSGYDPLSSPHLLNDYWTFNPTNYFAAWLAGGGDTLTTDSLRPTFGTEGVSADSVYPGARFNAAAVVDQQGRVWLFGGQGYASTGSADVRNDLFELSYPATSVFAGGDGTAGNPYQVTTLNQLQSIGSYLDANFKLTADIDASATSTWNPSSGIYRGFLPIGTSGSPFAGSIDGGSHVVSGLTINRGSTSAVGLVGWLNGSVKNLALDSVNIIGQTYVGGLAGRDLGSIDDCSVTGTVVGSGSAVGGLTGDVYSGSVDRSYSTASVTGGVYSGSGSGGLAGSVYAGSVTDSYARGNVSGNDGVGGLVGSDDYTSTISRTYSSGSVSGSTNVGGLAGTNTNGSTISNSFWDEQSSGEPASSGGTGETTVEMQSGSTFSSAGWDFTTPVWQMSAGVNNGYPYLSDVAVLDNSLAVEADDFSATSQINSVRLAWNTQSEVDNAGFIILREDLRQTLQSGEIGSYSVVGSYKNDETLRGLGTSSSGRGYKFVDGEVISGSTYLYKIQSVKFDGTKEDLTSLSVTVQAPLKYTLYQNYPNPFNPSTTIRFDLREQSDVTLDIYDVLGQQVLHEIYQGMNTGRYDKTINMSRFPSGVYFFRINANGIKGDGFVAIKKMVLMK